MTAGGPRIVFGAAVLGNLFEAMTEAESAALLEAVWESGVRHFDTAPHYGIGLSERRLGAFLREQSADSFTVSTKVGRTLVPNPALRSGEPVPQDDNLFVVPAHLTRAWDFTYDGVCRQLTDSLDRLGLDRVDTLYVHDPEEAPRGETDLASGLDALVSLREQGLVRRIGVGSKSVPMLEFAVRHGAPDDLMVAGRHTLIDHSAAASLLPLCRERGVTATAAAVFNSGLLATQDPRGPYEYGAAPDEVLTRARRIADVCAAHGTDLPTAALHWVTRDAAVTSVVISGRTPEQVRENVARLAATLDPHLWSALEAEGLVPAALGTEAARS